MFTKILSFAGLIFAVTGRSLHLEDVEVHPYLQDGSIIMTDFEDNRSDQPEEFVHPMYLQRIRRQLGSVSTNPDGTSNVNFKLPLVTGENNVLSAIGTVAGSKPGGSYGAAGAGLALDNINGHALSVSGKHIPGFGDQLTGAAKLAVLNTPDHKLNANAFATKTMPSIPNFPDFNTRGAAVDYTFKDKIGASLGTSYTDLFKKTDYSAMGNYNIFKDRASSLDLNAGYTKSQSPFANFNHNWQPSGGLTYSRYF